MAATPDFIRVVEGGAELIQPIQEEPVQEIPVLEEEPNVPLTVNKNGNYAETVIVHKAPLPESIRKRLTFQKNKYWHFMFRHAADEQKLLQDLGQLSLTGTYSYAGSKHADLTLSRGEETVGKIHFLYADRRDICEPSKFYIKVHFYQFQDQALFEQVKQLVKSYFEKWSYKSLTRKSMTRKSIRKSHVRKSQTKRRSHRQYKN